MNKEAKRDGDYVSYCELFRLVQAGRRELGLPEYRHRSSLHFALVANRIPTKKVNCRKKIYHAPTALRVLCPGTAVAGEYAPQPHSEQWATLSEVYRKANPLRRSLGMPPLKSASSACATLRRKNVPRRRYGPRNYYWQLEPALRALTHHNDSKGTPRHRPGTKQELASGEFMPLMEAARMLRCSPIRLASAAAVYSILAFRHPHTNMLWVRVKDASVSPTTAQPPSCTATCPMRRCTTSRQPAPLSPTSGMALPCASTSSLNFPTWEPEPLKQYYKSTTTKIKK